MARRARSESSKLAACRQTRLPWRSNCIVVTRSGGLTAALFPDHELVPAYYEQEPVTGAWLIRDATDSGWLEQIYANRGLFTKIGEATGSWGTAAVGLSSTSTPGLMTRMLETLDIHEGHKVLEIGTGTGYNAALLAHRLGAEHVFSVDVDRELVDLARDQLARIGYRPTLVAADGASGLSEHAPYDRIIATCSVPAVPPGMARPGPYRRAHPG